MISYKPFRRYMLDNDINNDDLRCDLGLSNDTLTRISKDRDMRVSTIEKICKYYKIPIEKVIQIK